MTLPLPIYHPPSSGQLPSDLKSENISLCISSPQRETQVGDESPAAVGLGGLGQKHSYSFYSSGGVHGGGVQ